MIGVAIGVLVGALLSLPIFILAERRGWLDLPPYGGAVPKPEQPKPPKWHWGWWRHSCAWCGYKATWGDLWRWIVGRGPGVWRTQVYDLTVPGGAKDLWLCRTLHDTNRCAHDARLAPPPRSRRTGE